MTMAAFAAALASQAHAQGGYPAKLGLRRQGVGRRHTLLVPGIGYDAVDYALRPKLACADTSPWSAARRSGPPNS